MLLTHKLHTPTINQTPSPLPITFSRYHCFSMSSPPREPLEPDDPSQQGKQVVRKPRGGRKRLLQSESESEGEPSSASGDEDEV